MNLKCLSTLRLSIAIIGFLIAPAAFGEGPDADLIAAFQDLHKVNEDQAIKQLAREEQAAENYKLVRDMELESYAGSWFDEASHRLVVALADPADRDLLNLLNINVQTVLVKRSLAELRREYDELLTNPMLRGVAEETLVKSYIDRKSNQVVIGVYSSSPKAADFITSVNRLYSDRVRIIQYDQLPTLSSGSLRGADATRNLDWQQQFGGTWPCSIGVSTVNGFIFAGHCGEPGNDIGNPSGNQIGEVISSTWFQLGSNNPDMGNVDKFGSWTPTAQINGYSDGILSVPAIWAGTLESPIGATVCRYGGTSGGPHCGIVDQKNVTVNFGSLFSPFNVTGLTQLAGSCSDDGDSGGPHISGTTQIQGINIGKQNVNPGDTCPTPAQYVWFQPVKDFEQAFNSEILTAHGASIASISNFKCPDLDNSGQGVFTCSLGSYSSQGETTIAWAGGGRTGDSASFFGFCSPGTVNVTLAVTNPYGTLNRSASFPCPTGPIP